MAIQEAPAPPETPSYSSSDHWKPGLVFGEVYSAAEEALVIDRALEDYRDPLMDIYPTTAVAGAATKAQDRRVAAISHSHPKANAAMVAELPITRKWLPELVDYEAPSQIPQYTTDERIVTRHALIMRASDNRLEEEQLAKLKAMHDEKVLDDLTYNNQVDSITRNENAKRRLARSILRRNVLEVTEDMEVRDKVLKHQRTQDKQSGEATGPMPAVSHDNKRVERLGTDKTWYREKRTDHPRPIGSQSTRGRRLSRHSGSRSSLPIWTASGRAGLALRKRQGRHTIF